MCGIAGIIHLNGQAADRHDVEKMIRVVRYRGPDDEGYFLDKNIGLGHCRLSIIDLTREGHQPMSNEDGSLWVVHNGEIYNYVELASELAGRGHVFKSRTDTEIILHAYEEWGHDCLHRFNGMWAFAIWDRRKRQIFCSRDRFGVKPFYYYFDRDKFLFASEIKQLLDLAQPGFKVNDRIVYDYLFWGYENHSSETFFEDIRQLPGGHSLICETGCPEARPRIEKWYDLKRNVSGLKFREGADYLHHLLEDSVKLRLRSDVPVGSCLSGGIDSSSIVCLASRILKTQSSCRQEVFTSCFKESELDETRYAHLVAEKSSCIENFVYPDIDALKRDLEDLVWHQEEPFGGLSIFSQWCIMREAKKKKIKVLLDGQGADELFLGYERYYVFFLRELVRKNKYVSFLKELFFIPQRSKLSLFQLFRYALYFSSFSFRRYCLRARANKVISQDFLKKGPFFPGESRIDARSESFNEWQKEEISHFQLPHLLRYEDKNSMAFSIETRLPFLDYRMVEFSHSLPHEFKIKDGWSKYILRESMRQVIPQEVMMRKRKIGFEVPEHAWLKQLKPEIVSHVGNNDCMDKYINRRVFSKNVETNKVSSTLLWRIYNLSLWLDIFHNGRYKRI